MTIIKVARDEDLYMVWSYTINNAVAVGTADQIAEYLAEEAKKKALERIRNDIAAAAANGSSAKVSNLWWDAREPGWLIVDNEVFLPEPEEEDAYYRLTRDKFAAFAHALLRDDSAAALQLVELCTD